MMAYSSEMPRFGVAIWRPVGFTVRVIGRILWRMRVEQEAPLPDGPFVVASNHYSHFDPPLLASALPARPVRFMALDELRGNVRFIDASLDVWGTIPVNRRNRNIAAVKEALASLAIGQPVGVFPEGRRVAAWGETPPKRGAAWLANRAAVPLVPAAIVGSDSIFGMDNKLRRGILKIVVGKPIRPDLPVETLMDQWEAWAGRQLGSGP